MSNLNFGDQEVYNFVHKVANRSISPRSKGKF